MRAGKEASALADGEAEAGCGQKRGAALRAERAGMQLGLTSKAGARGFIVVAVLWILAELSALVLIYLVYVTNTAVVVAGSTDRIQAEALVTAGVELAAYQLMTVKEGLRPTSGTFNARVGQGRVFVIFRSEAARVDLNAAPQVLPALPNMTPENLQSVLTQRGDPALDPQSLIGMVGGEGATVSGSRAYRIAVDVELPDGRRSGAEIVILLLEGGDEPYRVLSWRNASDGSTTAQRASSR